MEIKNVSDREEYESILKDQDYTNDDVISLVKKIITDEDEYPGIYAALEADELSDEELTKYIEEFINEYVVDFVVNNSSDYEEYDVLDSIDNYLLFECDFGYFDSIEHDHLNISDDSNIREPEDDLHAWLDRNNLELVGSRH